MDARCVRAALRWWRCLASAALIAAPLPADLTLENARWRIAVKPETLSVAVTVTGNRPVALSTGVARHAVSDLRQSDTKASWTWDADTELTLALDERDLNVRVTRRTPGKVLLLRQSSDACGNGLILPLAEGSYIPRANPVWRRFLIQQAAINTTEDLSLPLWGMDYGAYSLHWLLTEPFHNTLAFSGDGAGIALSVTHEFIAMEPGKPMTMLLHLGDNDLLAGAKRYRQWLMDHGRFEPLAKKLELVPDSAKLLGATHVYLWGSGLLAARDVANWPLFAARLNADDAFSRGIRERMEPDAKIILAQTHIGLNRYEQTALVRGVDAALDAWARESWQTPNPDLHQLATRYADLSTTFANAFQGTVISDRDQWGSGFSINTIKQLQDAGLRRMWLGIGDGWEGGLWHPAAVRAAVQAGFLIAPYDSYDTALPVKQDASWATAHLGDHGYRDCAITLANGSLKSGFQNKGHYTNPDCIRLILQERVRTLQAATGFNSWFLDSYAAGMLFDDYGKSYAITEEGMAGAESASMAWVGNALKLPVGSEDGNAVTARGILFAHGMEAPVMGWGDTDMQRNPQSPYFLGRWYPQDQPEIFFKPVALKDDLQTIHFDPRFRLPLYQAVFHDSIITTNHWSYDNLKFRNTVIQNELAQLLYNVPALFHLSADTLTKRLPAMQRQSAFFRPLHERLATQALESFAWLSDDHLVQQTRFAGGTTLTANFDATARTVDGFVLPARSVTASGAKGRATYVAEPGLATRP